MQRHFDDELQELHRDIIAMGTMAQEAIQHSISSLKNRNAEEARAVIAMDSKVDELELAIDEKCIDLIARYQPLASDLRFIAIGMKINADLERIADLCVDIAQRVLMIVDKPLLKPLVDIPKLSEIAQQMVKNVIDAFVKRDVDMARQVVLSDTSADKLRDTIQHELITDYLSKDTSSAERAVSLLLIARHLERICDHTTNIAEDIIYMVNGKVIKHHLERLDTL